MSGRRQKFSKSSTCTITEERIADAAERLPTYWGRVKNFDAARGLGFIDCEETKEVYDKDILVLRSQLGDHSNDTIVSFNIVEDARGVKAANVKIHPDGFPPGKEPKRKGKGKGAFGFENFKGKGKGIDPGQLWQALEMLGEMWGGGGWGGGGWDGWDDGWWGPSKSKGKGSKSHPY